MSKDAYNRCVVCGRGEGHHPGVHRVHDRLWHEVYSPPVSIDGPALRARRNALGLSSYQIANAIGVSATTVQAWERNRYRPSARHLAAYQRLLDRG